MMFAVGVITFMLASLQVLTCAPVSDFQSSDSVVLTFSNGSINQWNRENKTSTLKSTLANLATTYCNNNLLKCEIPSGTWSVTFQPENVKLLDNYPVNIDNNDLKVVLYIELPQNNDNSIKIPGDTILVIITNGKTQLVSDVGLKMVSVVTGATQSSADKIQGNKKLNKIMIPISFLLLLVVVLAAWILHRLHKKRKAREERELHKRYMNLKNAQKVDNCNFTDQNKPEGSMNTADIPLTQLSQTEEGSKPVLPDVGSPEVQAVNRNRSTINRRRKKVRKQSNRLPKKVTTDESDGVFDDENQKSDLHMREKSKRKGRRRKTRLSGEREHDGIPNEEYDVNQNNEVIAESGDEDMGDCQVNAGYQRDSENVGSGRSKTSDADSAVELSSSVASSQQGRPRNLPPIAQAAENEDI